MDFCAPTCVCQGKNNHYSAPHLITFSDHNTLLSKHFFILRVLVKWPKKRKSAALQDQNFSVYFLFVLVRLTALAPLFLGFSFPY